MKQVSIITYSQVFAALGFFFIACLPLVLLIKQTKVTGKISMDAH